MITQRSVNGDAMDVDENGYGPSDQASDTQSPAPAVQALPLLDTLTIGESKEVSTEVPRDLLPDTTFLEMPEHVTHSEWSSVAPGPLLVGGSNLVRMFDVAANPNIKVNDWEISVDSDHFDVEAICWLPEGDFAISVSEQTSVQGKGERRRGKLLQINSYGLGYPQILNPLSGVIFALRYNPGSKLLLALSGGLSTVLTIYSISEESEVLCHKELPSSQLFDAVWMNDNKFIACGTNVLQMFEVRDDQIRVTQTHDMHQEWYRIKYDPVCDIAAFVDEEMCCLRQYNIGTEDTRTQSFHSNDIHLSDFAFQPIQNPDSYVSGTPRLLATSTTDGLIQLWDVLNPFTCVHKLGMRGNELAMQLAFSPDGYLLAAAGYDSVTVWKPEAGGEPKALWKCEDQRLWRSRPEDDDETDWVHSLAWDMDGRKLVFALRDQV
jgi:WD40 repeat protein